MTTPRSELRSNSPVNKRSQHPGVMAGIPLLNRSQLVWVLFMTMFFAFFVAWNDRVTLIAFNNRAGTVNKAFQVNRNTNTSVQVKQISLIGERNSGTKWMWG